MRARTIIRATFGLLVSAAVVLGLTMGAGTGPATAGHSWLKPPPIVRLHAANMSLINLTNYTEADCAGTTWHYSIAYHKDTVTGSVEVYVVRAQRVSGSGTVEKLSAWNATFNTQTWTGLSGADTGPLNYTDSGWHPSGYGTNIEITSPTSTYPYHYLCPTATVYAP